MIAKPMRENKGVVSTLNQYEAPELDDSSASDDAINAPQPTTPMETIRKIYQAADEIEVGQSTVNLCKLRFE